MSQRITVIALMVSLSLMIQAVFINIWVSFQLIDGNGEARHQNRTIPFTDILYNDIHKYTNHFAYLCFLVVLLIASIIVCRAFYWNLYSTNQR